MGVLREAVEADAEALAALLFRSPQAGRMVLGQDRSADVFARRRAFEGALTVVSEEDGELVATASCGLKRMLVGGEETLAAYVFDVAVDGRARGRGLAKRGLAELEAWARGRGAALLYAHVARGNEASVRTFTSSGYRVVRDLTNRVYPAFRDRPGPPEGARPIDDWDAAAELLVREGAGFDLVRPLTGERLRELWTSLPGWRPEDVWTTGRALLGLWDHSPVSRSIPLELPPEVRLLDLVGRVVRALRIPFPRAPRLGEPVAYGVLLGGAGDPEELGDLLGAVLDRARGRGLDVVITFHDAERRPSWTKAAFSVPDADHLVAKPLGAGPAERLGARPVRVDPVDL